MLVLSVSESNCVVILLPEGKGDDDIDDDDDDGAEDLMSWSLCVQ